jgi:multidrug transporter EmrE-like cation transporter
MEVARPNRVYSLSSATLIEPTSPISARTAARRSFLLMFFCTLIGALAQMLIKQGTAQLGAHVTLMDLARQPSLFVRFCLGVIGNLRLFMGYVCYGVNTFLIALALKGRELSRLYPIIALTYVWVAVLSFYFLPDEHLNFFKSIGIVFVVGGVSILGLKK